jgi:hypothetical protein
MADSEKESLWSKFIGLLALIFGAYIGKYNWLALIIVVGGAVLFYWLASKYNKKKLKPFLPAIAVLGGQFAWFLFGFLYANNFAYVLFDVILILIGVIWLVLQPSMGPVILLALYESISFILNIVKILTTQLEAGIFAAFLLHAILRISAIVFLLIGYKKIRREMQTKKYWYYALNDHQEGPMSRDKLQQLIDEEILGPDTLIWSETLSEWTPIKTVSSFKLNSISLTLPPLPTKDNKTSI